MSNGTALAEQIDTGTTALTISDKPNFAILGIVPRSVDEMFALAERVAASGLVPKTYVDNPGAVLVAWQMGASFGLAPMQAVQCIAVVNGNPTVWGNGRRALVKAHPKFEWQTEEWDEPTKTAYCTMKRHGEPAQTKSFSIADAERAGLTAPRGQNKTTSLYILYPKEMCGQRAHARCTDSVFPDAVKGLRNAEDVIDLAPDQWEGKEAPRAVRMPEATEGRSVVGDGKPPKAETKATGTAAPANGEKITEAMHRSIEAAIGRIAAKDEAVRTRLREAVKQKYGVEHMTDLPKGSINEALAWVEDQVA